MLGPPAQWLEILHNVAVRVSCVLLAARSTLSSADLPVGCTGGVLAARANPLSSVPFVHTARKQKASGVGRETHATAGQEASATNSLTRLVGKAG